MNNYIINAFSLVLTAALMHSTSVLAEEDLAKKSQNPIGNMISLPMQNNTYFDVGPSEEWANSFQMKFLFAK